MFLIAEYCKGPFFMGWHLYVRQSRRKNTRNPDGGWGWLSRQGLYREKAAQPVFDALGIDGEIRNGGTDDGPIARFANSHPLPRSKVCDRPRGCVEVDVETDFGMLSLKADD